LDDGYISELLANIATQHKMFVSTNTRNAFVKTKHTINVNLKHCGATHF